MTDKLNEMNAMLNDAALEAVNGGASTITINGVKVLCKKHKVVKGDNLSTLAVKYNTTVKAIMKVNSIIKDPNKIQIGWVLLIPVNYKI